MKKLFIEIDVSTFVYQTGFFSWKKKKHTIIVYKINSATIPESLFKWLIFKIKIKNEAVNISFSFLCNKKNILIRLN